MNNDISKLLSECDKEPIHLVGSIQSVGFTLFIQPDSFEIVEYVGDVPSQLQSGEISKKSSKLKHIFAKEITTPIYETITLEDTTYSLKIHYTKPCIILEAILLKDTNFRDDELYINSIYQLFDDETNIYDKLCLYIKNLTNYDRVMVYKFDKDYNGEVVGEISDDAKHSYLHHHFPASDIPAQARALYVKNRVRFIADADDATLSLPKAFASIDMSEFSTRAVSPMHIEYLKNMGVKASMSISIVVDDKLWGLIACHNDTPKHLDLLEVKRLSIISLILSREFLRIKDIEYYKQKQEIEASFDNFLIHNKSFIDDKQSIKNTILTQLAKVFKSDFCALKINDLLYLPDEIDREFMASVDANIKDDEIFITDSLASIDISFYKYKTNLSGLFSFSFGFGFGRIYLFAKEQSKTITWAGKPQKDFTNGLVSPRKSFEAWVENLQAISKPWEQSTIDTTISIISRYADELFTKKEFTNPFDIIAQAKNSMIITSTKESDYEILFVNDAFYNLFGYTKDEVLGKNPRFLQDDDAQQAILKTIKNSIDNNQPARGIVRNYTKNGVMRYIELSISPIFTKENKIKYFLGIQKDVTNEQRILQQIKGLI